MSSSSSSSSGDQRTEKRYAPYIEARHSDFLDITVANRVINDSPFADYTYADANEAFFGIGYALSNFPSLYDMFGKFMAGFDVEGLWGSVFENTMNKPEINVEIAAEMTLADDKMVKGELADFQVGMRNLNTVPTSSFVIGKAVLEDKRIKVLSQISLAAKTKFLPEIGQEFVTHLNWGKKTVTDYAKVMKNYFIWKTDQDDANYNFSSRDALWPLTSLSFEGAALGTMQSIVGWNKTMAPRRRSVISKALMVASYTASVAVYGSYFGPWGTAIGAAVGFVIGIATMFF